MGDTADRACWHRRNDVSTAQADASCGSGMLHWRSDPIFLMTKASCLPKTNRPLRNGERQRVKRGLGLFKFPV
ncbi:MAG: hypothetical protein QOG67_3073 [Verrucomicrobiota bacterium]